MCENILKEDTMYEANTTNAFLIISDKRADISSIEQLSIVIRFLDKQSTPTKIQEEFLGFLLLDQLNAELVVTNILSFMIVA